MKLWFGVLIDIPSFLKVSRPQVVKKLWAYLKEKDLQVALLNLELKDRTIPYAYSKFLLQY